VALHRAPLWELPTVAIAILIYILIKSACTSSSCSVPNVSLPSSFPIVFLK
jgi:hypothetical protein